MTGLPADREWIEQRARAAGFSLAGIAAVPSGDDPTSRNFAHWIAAGHAGEMDYLKRADGSGNLLRGNLRLSLPWARSVIVCAINYNAAAPLSIDPAPPATGWIARYAWSGQPPGQTPGQTSVPADYHDVLLPRLHLVQADILARFGPDTQTRCYVDTGPILERDYAARAGIGWIGKNTCVLNQQQGSWLLLGVIVTSLEFASGAWSVLAADRCGTCTRCIDACPTDALIPPATPDAPRQMEASRCIAYLTIEKKGTIPEDLRAPMGRHVFGCDICQDVCPWNSRAPVPESTPLPARRDLINPSLAWLASLDGAAFNRWFRGSPLERTRRRRVLRNVAIAMGNSGEAEFVPQLEAWSQSPKQDRDDPVLAEAAAWALARLRSGPAAAK